MPESTSLRSMIHATDSTCTGWTANTAAATQAPGTVNRRNRCHSNTVLAKMQ